MYNSKELVVDPNLTFLSYNQTINAEFTLEEILDSPLWSINSDNGLIKAIPLFNCDKITSSNESDKVLDDNKCVILENDMDTIVKCISDDTGSMHYYAIELYAYAPYTKLDVISEVTVYCILHDEYLNTVGNVNVDVYIDDEISGNVTSDSNGVCRFKVNQPCTVKFVYGELESNIVVIDEPQIYTLSIETDTQSLFTDESVTVSGVLTVDGEVYADQSIALYDDSSLVDTLTTDSNGEYTKTVSGLSVGTHVFRAVHAHVRSISVSVTVNAHSYSLSIASDKQSILTSESVTISGVLLKDSGAFSGQSVGLYDGSTLIDTLTTDSDGEYSKTISGLTAGTHTFKAVNTNAESTTVSVTVTEPTPVHDYSLSVVSDKDIISYADGESATLTATLLDNNVAVAGETLNYVIKHGTTTISTGSDTTDNNGEISFTYSATGVGDVTVEVGYGSLLQETYEIEDCIRYDNALSDKSNNYSPNSNIQLTHDTDHYIAVSNVGNNVASNFYGLLDTGVPFQDGIVIECDIKQTITSTASWGILLSNSTDVSTSNVSKYYQLSSYNGTKGLTTNPWTEKRTNGSLSNNTWYHFKLTISNGSGTGLIKQGDTTVYSDSLSFSQFSSLLYICLTSSQYPSTIHFKNLKIKAL